MVSHELQSQLMENHNIMTSSCDSHENFETTSEDRLTHLEPNECERFVHVAGECYRTQRDQLMHVEVHVQERDALQVAVAERPDEDLNAVN